MRKTFNELTIEEFLRVLFGFPKTYLIVYTKMYSNQPTKPLLLTPHIEEEEIQLRDEEEYAIKQGFIAENLGQSKARKQAVNGKLKRYNITYRRFYISGTYAEVVSALSFLIDREKENNNLERTLLQEFIANNFDYNLPFPSAYDRMCFYKSVVDVEKKDSTKLLQQYFNDVASFNKYFNAEVVTPFGFSRMGNWWKIYDYLRDYHKKEVEELGLQGEKTKFQKHYIELIREQAEAGGNQIATAYSFYYFLEDILDIDFPQKPTVKIKMGRPITRLSDFIHEKHNEDYSIINNTIIAICRSFKNDAGTFLNALIFYLQELLKAKYITGLPSYGAIVSTCPEIKDIVNAQTYSNKRKIRRFNTDIQKKVEPYLKKIKRIGK